MSTPPPGSFGESLVGRTLNGVYRLVDLIGAGGFADVYLARDLRTNETVAVKILHVHVAREAGLVQRFNTEAEVARRLKGPNVARARDSGQEPGIPPYLVMDYVQGLSLAEIIRRRGQLPVQEAVRLIDQTLAALAEAHSLTIVHRDIKPANLMVDAQGILKVMDFGIARVLEGGGNTTIGHILGTPAYMAPEQVAGQPVDYRTDLYAVGVVLYELLAGKSPFGGSSDPMVAMARVMNEAPAPISTLRNDVPPSLAACLDRALSKSPEWRFQTAHEMRQALSQAVGPPPTAQMPPVPPPPGGWPQSPPGSQQRQQTPAPYSTPGPQPYGVPGSQLYGTPPPPPPSYTAPAAQPPMLPGAPHPFVPPTQTGQKSPLPLILGIGAVALLLLGGFVGLLSARGFGGSPTPTPTVVQLAAATSTTAPAQPTPTTAAAVVPTPAPPTTAPTAPPKPAPPTPAPPTPAPPTPVPPTSVPPTQAPPTPVPPTAIPVRPTATLLPRSLFQANFNNGDPRGLFIGMSNDRAREHLVWDGEYAIKTLTNQPANSIAFLPGTQGVNDGVLAATVRIIDAADYAFVSLSCRAQNTDLVSHYTAQLTTSPPAVRLRRVDGGQSTGLVDWTQNPVIRGGRLSNRLEIRCIGSTISIAVNGVQIVTFQDERYQAGWWSVGAGTFGDMAGRAEGRFDDIELRAR